MATGSWEALAIVMGAGFVAAIGGGWTCWVRSWCVDAGTCVGIGHSDMFPAFQCSFSNAVPLISDLLYHGAASNASLAGLTRGICGVGERLTLSAVTGQPTCVLLRPYPNAMDKEVMNPSASTEHERACGAWMDKSLVQNVEYFALDDSTERAEAVRHAEAAQHAGTRLSSTNLGKFRAACQRAVLGGSAALRSAGELAYQHLIAAADINGVTDNETALQSLGKLVGHYCDGPILFGWELKVNGTRTSVRRGRAFEPYAMASAMQLVRAPVALQLSAEVGNKHVNDYGYSSPEASWSQIMMVLRSATERPISDDPLADANYADPYQAEFDGFVDLLANGALADAKGYLHGVAGMCAFSLEAIVSSPGYTATDAAWNWRSRIQREEPRAAALGSLQPPPGHSPMFEVDGTDVLNASSITMSQLVGAPSGDADTACLAFTRLMFPDEIERMHFDLVISPTLYDRMESMVAQVRAGTAHVLRNDATIRGALTDPDTVAGYVDVARIRIPGAPRGTWAGSSRSIPVATFDSSDGVFIMAAKQARALYLDRQSSLVYDATHPCEGPSYYTALTANVSAHSNQLYQPCYLQCVVCLQAFIFPSYRCSYYLYAYRARTHHPVNHTCITD